ncbi:hypothetical protein, partial [Photobacterium sp. R1]
MPIIALTASVLEKDRRNALAAGMNGFAVKPIDIYALKAEIAYLKGIISQAPVHPEKPDDNQDTLIDL